MRYYAVKQRRNAMKKVRLYTMAVMLLMIAGSCAVTDVDRSADFKSYRTYSWGKSEADVKKPAYNSDLISKNIRTTVEEEFAKRGIIRDKRNPDFLVSYKTYTEERREPNNGAYYGYGYPFYPMRFYPYGFGWGYPYAWGVPPRERSFTEGTLIIDITDKATQELVWRGTVKGNVDNLSGLQRQIQKGIRAIMKKYPISPAEPLPLKGEKAIS
jgi:hypothetical protein